MMRVLVLGALPPPIGGVSIHIDRFLDYCWENDSENSIVAFDIKKRRLFTKEGNYGFLSGFVFFRIGIQRLANFLFVSKDI